MNLQNINKIFHSQIKSLEIFFLLHDIKNVVRQGFYEDEIQKIKLFCNQNKLFITQSKFKVIIADLHKPISDKGLRVAPNDLQEGMFFYYISKNEKLALLAEYFELIEDHKKLGKILEYPSCCISYFSHNYRGEDLTHKPINMFTNLAQRKEDYCLLSHFPCSSNCQKSIQIAKIRFTLLEKFEPEFAKKLQRTLTP